uniref:NADH-ubiquinone oxidoreductase chain 4L n=1 Tax=Mastigias sp. TaxID=3082107 RepID=A0AAU0GWF3_9CNID|nr:NADH dehydrogenase subunit 4L [Phyllorhiza punctata]
MGIKPLITCSFTLFLLGVLGVSINRSNLIILLMSIELMLLSTSLMFVVASVFYNQILGQLFTLFIFTVAAAESAIGLAIIVSYFRLRGKVSIKLLNILKG